MNRNPQKIVVRPRVWIGGGSHEDIGGPDEWIRVDARSMQERLNARPQKVRSWIP